MINSRVSHPVLAPARNAVRVKPTTQAPQLVDGLIFALALVKTQLEAMQMSAGWFYGGGSEAIKGEGRGGYQPAALHTSNRRVKPQRK